MNSIKVLFTRIGTRGKTHPGFATCYPQCVLLLLLRITKILKLRLQSFPLLEKDHSSSPKFFIFFYNDFVHLVQFHVLDLQFSSQLPFSALFFCFLQQLRTPVTFNTARITYVLLQNKERINTFCWRQERITENLPRNPVNMNLRPHWQVFPTYDSIEGIMRRLRIQRV